MNQKISQRSHRTKGVISPWRTNACWYWTCHFLFIFFYPSLTPNTLLFFPLLPNRIDCVLPRADPLSGGRRWRAFHPRAPQRRHQPGAHGGLLHSAGYEQGFAHLKQPPHPQTSLLSCLLLPVVTLNMTGVSALFLNTKPHSAILKNTQRPTAPPVTPVI